MIVNRGDALTVLSAALIGRAVLHPLERISPTMTAPVLPPTKGTPAAISGEVLASVAGHDAPPQDGLDLTYRLWSSLTWPRTWQVVVLLLALAGVAAGLGVVLYAAAGATGLWTALGGATGAGATAGAGALRRRCTARRGKRK